MARRTNSKIVKRHLILCEGRDAEEFLITYLNSEALSDNPSFANDLQVMDFGGNSELPVFLANVMNMENYDKVESILIIRDAEKDVTRAQNDIISALTECNLSAPHLPYEWKNTSPKVGYLLFPTCNQSTQVGTLEDLCLAILAEVNREDIIKDIQQFMNEIGEKHNRAYPHEFKTKLHTYFSVTDAYVSLKIGEAAKAGAFDWNSEKLMPLKNFLLQVVASQ